MVDHNDARVDRAQFEVIGMKTKMTDVEFIVDGKNGLLLTCHDRSGEVLRSAEPLLRWISWQNPATPATAIRSGRAPDKVSPRNDGWSLSIGPDKLECEIHPTTVGSFGQSQFSIVITNDGSTDIHGMLLPPFSEWIGGPEGEGCWCMAHDVVFVGPSPGMYAWPPREFAKDVFAAVPAGRDSSLTAVLVRITGEIGRAHV
jgi:hypothetical protein